jgi:hypothetical protein
MTEIMAQDRADIKAQDLSTVDKLMLQFFRPLMAIQPHPTDTRQSSLHADTAAIERFHNLTQGFAT